MQEDSLEIGFNNFDAIDRRAVVLGSLDNRGEQPPTVASHKLDMSVSHARAVNTVETARDVDEALEIAAGSELDAVVLVEHRNKLAPRPLGNEPTTIDDA